MPRGVSLDPARTAAIRRTYVHQSGEPMRSNLQPFADRAAAESWSVTTLDSQHDSMLIIPDAVAAVIDEAAAGGPGS